MLPNSYLFTHLEHLIFCYEMLHYAHQLVPNFMCMLFGAMQLLQKCSFGL